MEDKSDLNKKIDKLLVENKKLFSPDVLTIIIGVTGKYKNSNWIFVFLLYGSHGLKLNTNWISF